MFKLSSAAPVIESPPTNVSQLEGQSVTFRCVAVSEPLHTVQWYFMDTLLYESGKYSIEGDSVSPLYGQLTISSVNMNDAGVYVCFVNNTHGNDTASATLTVQG